MTPCKFKLVIAYDGAGYAGWQAQRDGLGVQEVVEEALKKMFPGVGRIHGAGRTDTGVHAQGMVAHVEVPREQFRMTLRKLPLAINAHLPDTVRVLKATRCPTKFHARFDATGKQYRYFVWNHTVLNPLWRHQCWHVPRPVNFSAMQQAAQCFVGTHDFKSFAGQRPYQMRSTLRTVYRFDLRRSGPLLTFIFEGDGFLYKMCRNLAGTVVQIGLGKHTPESVRDMLQAKDRRAGGMTAPAKGLVLWKVYYR